MIDNKTKQKKKIFQYCEPLVNVELFFLFFSLGIYDDDDDGVNCSILMRNKKQKQKE